MSEGLFISGRRVVNKAGEVGVVADPARSPGTHGRTVNVWWEEPGLIRSAQPCDVEPEDLEMYVPPEERPTDNEVASLRAELAKLRGKLDRAEGKPTMREFDTRLVEVHIPKEGLLAGRDGLRLAEQTIGKEFPTASDIRIVVHGEAKFRGGYKVLFWVDTEKASDR